MTEKLRKTIRKAIGDKKISTKEFEEIISVAFEDATIDPEEADLLLKLKTMVEKGEIEKV